LDTSFLPITFGEHWRGDPFVALGPLGVRTLVDLRSDRRIIVLYSNFIAERATAIDVAMSFVAAGDSILFALRDVGVRELVAYKLDRSRAARLQRRTAAN
jgi:hypothetical protein